jgi:hypothetical protein
MALEPFQVGLPFLSSLQQGPHVGASGVEVAIDDTEVAVNGLFAHFPPDLRVAHNQEVLIVGEGFGFIHVGEEVETADGLLEFGVEGEDEGLDVVALLGVGLVLCSWERAEDLVMGSADNNDKIFFAINIVMEGGGVASIVFIEKFSFLYFLVGSFFDDIGDIEFFLVLIFEHIAREETVEH